MLKDPLHGCGKDAGLFKKEKVLCVHQADETEQLCSQMKTTNLWNMWESMTIGLLISEWS